MEQINIKFSNQSKFRLGSKQKENLQYNHIPFNYIQESGIYIRVFDLQEQSLFRG